MEHKDNLETNNVVENAEAKATEEKEKKKGGIGAWIYRLLIVALLGVMCFSGYNLYKIYDGYHESKVIYNDLADEVGAGKKTGTDNTRLHIDWESLLGKCGDVKAWIRDPKTVINYPVVQGANNNEYLYRAITGEPNNGGTIFIDAGCEDPFNVFLTVLYGHRMKDGSMFKALVNYFGSGGAEYYKEHPTIELYTFAKTESGYVQNNFDIEVFACATIDGTDMAWYEMEYTGDIATDMSINQAYLDRALAVNELETGKDFSLEPTDHIVMMSTCTKELDDNRQVVWGKLVKAD